MLGKTEGRRRGDGRGRGCWMASPTQWTWVWISFRSWWWTGRPGVLQSTGSQRVRHDWATEPNWIFSSRGSLFPFLWGQFGNCARRSSLCHGHSLVIMQLTSSTWWRFWYLQNISKEMAQNIIYRPWRRTKGRWLCLMIKLLFVWLLFFASALFHFFLMKFILWLNVFFTKCRQKTRAGWRFVLGRPHRILPSYYSSGVKRSGKI